MFIQHCSASSVFTVSIMPMYQQQIQGLESIHRLDYHVVGVCMHEHLDSAPPSTPPAVRYQF